MKAIAPGKIILSGEHAVVYGAPAIAIAVQKYATVETAPCDDAVLRVHTPFGDGAIASLEDADALDERLHARYHAFLKGDLPIAEVMPDKHQFVELGWLLYRKHLPETVQAGVSITATSDLPFGSGMGSSAAIAAAIVTSLAAYYQINLIPETCFKLALELESFQHGHPSGVDPYLATYGGAVCYRRNSAPETLSLPAQDLCIINTGSPAASTGECVAHVRETHATSTLWPEFEQICDEVRNALGQRNEENLITAVRANHQLLIQIGVVPQSIQQRVSQIEDLGGAAKICGAGSIRGDVAGIVWVVGEEARAALPDFGYSPISMEGDSHGARIVD